VFVCSAGATFNFCLNKFPGKPNCYYLIAIPTEWLKMNYPKQIIKNTSGASLIEYGMLSGLIAVSAISAVVLTGEKIDDSLTHSGDQLYIYRQLAAGNDPSAECYNPDNVGLVGTGRWAACDGMLIVSEEMLRAAASTDIPVTPGDGSYAITADDGQVYTFQNDDMNIFTGQVADMSNLFRRDSSWNGDIGYWDTSSATDMSNMFYQASSFNQDIGQWSTDNVQNMSSMFFNATAFNADISEWTVSNVTSMQNMFSLASSFNQPIGAWGSDMANVTSTAMMFYAAADFNHPLNAWDTSGVTNMSSMFESAIEFQQDIGNWQTGAVTNMDRMFFSASQFNADLSNWCVDNFAPGSPPNMFDMSADNWSEARPVWGSCPAP
jgi:surface protein